MNASSVATARLTAPSRSVAAAGVKASGRSAAPLLPARFVDSASAPKHSGSCACGTCRKSVVAFASPEPERPNSPNLPKPSGWSPQGISGDVAPIKENPLDASRPFRRTVFTLQDWKRHRSMSRYRRHLNSMPRSGIVSGLLPYTLFYAGEAAAIMTYNTIQAQGLLPEWLPTIPDIGLTPFNLTAFALSLLLVFRTNSSYGRWDEARKLWGGQVNRSRDLARQALTYIEDRQLACDTARWTKAFNKCMMCHLRDDRDFEEELMGAGLTQDETNVVLSAAHRPVFCLQVISSLIARAENMSPQIRAIMDENLGRFEDHLGACERIFRTPVPLFYTHHISRFITIWCAFLPLGLWKTLQWDAVPAMFLISFLLVAIDEIGVQLEEPFGILPLEAITNTMNTNIDEVMKKNDEAKAFAAKHTTLPASSKAPISVVRTD